MKSVAVLQGQLGHISSFNSQIDSRATGILAMNTAILAVAAVNLKLSDFCSFPTVLSIVILSVASVFGLAMIYALSFPTLKGEGNNLTYFGDIAKQQRVDFVAGIARSSSDAYSDWIIEQIWVVSSIVARRFTFLRLATISLMVAAVAFISFLIFSSILHASLPTLKVG